MNRLALSLLLFLVCLTGFAQNTFQPFDGVTVPFRLSSQLTFDNTVILRDEQNTWSIPAYYLQYLGTNGGLTLVKADILTTNFVAAPPNNTYFLSVVNGKPVFITLPQSSIIQTNLISYTTNFYINNTIVSNYFTTNVFTINSISNYFFTNQFFFTTNQITTNTYITNYLQYSTTVVSNTTIQMISTNNYVSNYFQTNIFLSQTFITTNSALWWNYDPTTGYITNVNGGGVRIGGTNQSSQIYLYDGTGSVLEGGFDTNTHAGFWGPGLVWTNTATQVFLVNRSALTGVIQNGPSDTLPMVIMDTWPVPDSFLSTYAGIYVYGNMLLTNITTFNAGYFFGDIGSETNPKLQTGNDVVAIGDAPIFAATNLNDVIAIGDGPASAATNLQDVVAIGDSSLTAESLMVVRGVFIGKQADVSSSTPLTNVVAIGTSATVTKNNEMALGGSAMTDYVFRGIDYGFPAASVSGVLSNSNGTLTWVPVETLITNNTFNNLYATNIYATNITVQTLNAVTNVFNIAKGGSLILTNGFTPGFITTNPPSSQGTNWILDANTASYFTIKATNDIYIQRITNTIATLNSEITGAAISLRVLPNGANRTFSMNSNYVVLQTNIWTLNTTLNPGVYQTTITNSVNLNGPRAFVISFVVFDSTFNPTNVVVNALLSP